MYYKLENFRMAAQFLTVNALHVDRILDQFVSEAVQCGTVNSYRIIGKSIDSRRSNAELVYNLIIESDSNELRPGAGSVKLTKLSDDEAIALLGINFRQSVLDNIPKNRTPKTEPIVVGSGPGGIFAAYYLALAGYKPLILDRGFQVEKRLEDIENFYKTRELNESSNFLMGEGGAGTFSDGKLYTRINSDWYGRFVLSEFINMGAPEEIAYLKRPHIGSDNLFKICQNFRKKIIELGGSFRFGFTVNDILVKNGRCGGVIGANGEKIESETVIIAAGVGGRELQKTLINRGIEFQMKGFQVGCRVEHPQNMIDRQQYHQRKRPIALGAAEYNMVSKPPVGIPGVSTFCMCPGGEVVMSSTTTGQASTNGMSYYSRSGEFANSCLIVTYTSEEFSHPQEAWTFLNNIEKNIFIAGGENYTLPAQGAKAFLAERNELTRGKTSTKVGINSARLDKIFPQKLKDGISFALKKFDRMMPGFIAEGNLIGFEAFVSSPCRFMRGEDGASSLPGLYLAGEGAGFAGGIISGAVDGVKIAEQIIKKG